MSIRISDGLKNIEYIIDENTSINHLRRNIEVKPFLCLLLCRKTILIIWILCFSFLSNIQ